jgi:hypothetical protein
MRIRREDESSWVPLAVGGKVPARLSEKAILKAVAAAKEQESRKGSAAAPLESATSTPREASKKDQLYVGMPLSEIVQLLGQPTSSAGGEDLLAGAGKVFGSPPAYLSGRAWYTWKRPEGTYTLTIQDGKLANIQSAPG